MNDGDIHSGFDVKNKDSLPEKYQCSVCQRILKDPVQLGCGDRACKSCLPTTKKVRCLKCSKATSTSKIRLDKGFNLEMQTLIVLCIFCDWSGPLKSYEHHLQQLHKQFRCSLCNETFASAKLLDEHRERICPTMAVHCPLKSYGCETQVLRRDLQQHYLTVEHQQVLLSLLSPFLSTLSNNDKTTPMDTEAQVEPQKGDVSSAITTTSVMVTTEQCDDELQDTKKMVDILSGGIDCLGGDTQRLSDTSVQLSEQVKDTEQQLTAIQTSLEITNGHLNGMNINVDLLQQQCSSLKQTMEEYQYISYDGTMIWKITNVQEKLADARTERQVSVYSQPFFTSSSGYKACARVYLLGDGNARNTHMSLFFVLMRGPNDSLLPFPFNYKVTFCLYDQSEEQKHIVDSFRPDTRSNSFQKPRSDMNIASGIPKFAPLSIIQQPNSPYIRNDTMFIKVLIDFENIPRTILPFAMSINPGLPAGVQQRLIQTKMQQQTQTT